MKNEQFTELTATGIVPELHRSSLLIPNIGNQIGCKCNHPEYKFKNKKATYRWLLKNISLNA
jgi:hypothetical protein